MVERGSGGGRGCYFTYTSFFPSVERRRRDRINELIKMLAQIVPGCQKKDATTGNIVGVGGWVRVCVCGWVWSKDHRCMAK